MPIRVKGWAFQSSDNPVLSEIEYDLPSNETELDAHEVLVEVISCSLCHSDLHMAQNDWNISTYPIVTGHEVIGKVVAKGTKVSHLEINETVGIGWQSGSCTACNYCIRGEEPRCNASQATIIAPHKGGLASHVVCQDRFAFSLKQFPQDGNLPLLSPLLCAGATVWTPISKHLKPGMRVGVIGMGGLGSVALQFCRSLGHETILLTRGTSKRADALALGAAGIVDMTSESDIAKYKNSIDLILNTATVELNWDRYFGLLAKGGVFVLLGIPGQSPLVISPMSFVFQTLTLEGSLIAGSVPMTEMLNFARVNKIVPMVDVMPMSRVNEAFDKLRAGNVRYRIVLKR
ncbi:hypothetical protein RCL1_008955 [Eukaryota sp. TZLM3-RCL]